MVCDVCGRPWHRSGTDDCLCIPCSECGKIASPDSLFQIREGQLANAMSICTADTHFSHQRLAEIRGFASTEEMDEALVERWNRKVPQGATVWHLGDFCLGKPDRVARLLHKLHGSINLVRGNHDRLPAWTERKFGCAKDLARIKVEERKIVLCHYPILVWDGAHHGAWHLHGHSHGKLRDMGTTRLDIGVDTHPDLEPWSWEEIQERMEIGNLEWIRRHRQFAAEGWKKVRKWRQTATDRQRELFADRWLNYPHLPEYALDLIHHIELGWVTVPIHTNGSLAIGAATEREE